MGNFPLFHCNTEELNTRKRQTNENHCINIKTKIGQKTRDRKVKKKRGNKLTYSRHQIKWKDEWKRLNK